MFVKWFAVEAIEGRLGIRKRWPICKQKTIKINVMENFYTFLLNVLYEKTLCSGLSEPKLFSDTVPIFSLLYVEG